MAEQTPAAPPQNFCAACTQASTDKTPGDVSTTNGIGRKFYGGAAPCVTCGSVIRTLWITLVDIPIVPLGSYRYKTASEAGLSARFWCRQTAWNWSQILVTWVIGLSIGAAAFIAIYLYEESKKKK